MSPLSGDARPPRQAAEWRVMRPSETQGRHTALVVEDNAAFSALIGEALAAVGAHWQLRTAVTGREALTLLASPDAVASLVFVDLGLPDMSGVDVIRAARARWPDAPVLVVSVLSNSASVVAAVQAGARGYLQKDDSALSLAQAIQRVLAGEYAISPSLAQHLFRFVVTHAPPASADDDAVLSPRELELLKLLGQGYTYDEAARRMQISLHTAHTFSKRIYLKLEVGSKGAALAQARDRGWIR